MTNEELKEIISKHAAWLRHEGGARANLTGANLFHAHLSGVDLSHANLSGANLTGALLTSFTA